MSSCAGVCTLIGSDSRGGRGSHSGLPRPLLPEAAVMRGRRPAGPEYVEQLDGSTLARERLKVVLQTLAGQCRVAEACERLGICEQRFHQIREEALRAAVAALEPRPAGRPAQSSTTPAELPQALLEQIEHLEVQL